MRPIAAVVARVAHVLSDGFGVRVRETHDDEFLVVIARACAAWRVAEDDRERREASANAKGVTR